MIELIDLRYVNSLNFSQLLYILTFSLCIDHVSRTFSSATEYFYPVAEQDL